MTQHDPAADQQAQAHAGKGRPTPSRKEAQARNARPLVGDRSKEARKRLQAERRAQNERIRIGQANGEERYLTARDRGPQRRFIRDYVDARWTVGEFMLPIMFAIVLLTFLPWPEIATRAFLAMVGVLIMLVADSILLSITLGRRLRQKFGKDEVQRGWRWYAVTRAMQMRLLRLPKPAVKRGEYPN